MKKGIIFLFSFLAICVGIQARVAQIDSMLEGRLNMCVDPGDHEIKGQPLFFVDYDALQIAKDKAKDNAAFCLKNLERDKKLAKSHNISLVDLQKAETDLVSAMQDAKTAEVNILNSYYFAPFNGIVTMVKSYTGSAIGDGSPVVEVTETTPKTDVKAIENKINSTSTVAQTASMTAGIIDLHVKPGEFVHKGQLLFKVNTVPGDSTTYIEPQKMLLENALRYNQEIYTRQKKLVKAHCISVADYEKAKINYKNAMDNFKSFCIAERNSRYYAPFDGVVTKINNYSGSDIGDGNDIVEVTKAKQDSEHAKSLTQQARLTPQVAQVDSIIEGILQLKVKPEQHVKKGKLLFSINTSTLENQKKKDLINVNYCQQQYERMKKLFSSNSIPLKDFEAARYNLVNAIANLKTTELNLKYSHYYAPFDGVVTKIVNSDRSAIGDGNEVVEITRTTPTA